MILLCNENQICSRPANPSNRVTSPFGIVARRAGAFKGATMKSKHGTKKHGDKRPDGKTFWGYNNCGKGKVLEMWYSPGSFQLKKDNRKIKAAVYRAKKETQEMIFENRIKSEYGITAKQYDDILASQKGVCAICGQPEKVTSFKRLAIDHCHESNKIRGLLCYRCNTALGKFEDNTSLLEKAITYLKTADALLILEYARQTT